MLPIIAHASLSEADTQALHAGLLAADPEDQPRGYAPLALTVHEDGRLIAGLMVATAWTWLSIDALWVKPARRTQGYGRRLVAEAEAIARTRGCRHARLDTFDFQARGFYERLGYHVYAELA